MKYLGTEFIRDIQRDMFDYMPKEYEEYLQSNALITAESSEFERYHAQMTDVLNQFFIDNATWGLAIWERVIGVITDESKPDDERRSLIKSKIRGIGTVTASLIKNVAEAYANGEVSVTEIPSTYTIKITFIDTRGVPSNLADIQSVIRDILPAHLAVSFEFTYLRWSELDAKSLTWSALDGMALTWDQFERLQ